MPSKNKISVVLIVTAFLLAAVFGGVYFLNRPKIWRAIPPGAAAVLEWPLKSRLPADSLSLAACWPAYLWDAFPETNTDWRFFTALFARPEWQPVIAGRGSALTLVSTGLDQHDLTLAFVLENQPEQTALSLLGGLPAEVTRFRGVEIFQAAIPGPAGPENIALAVTRGLVLLARHPLQVEEIAAQLSENRWFEPPAPAKPGSPYIFYLLPGGVRALQSALPGQFFGGWPESDLPCLQLPMPLFFQDTITKAEGYLAGLRRLLPPGNNSDDAIWNLAPGNTAWFCRVRQPAFRSFKDPRGAINLFERYLSSRAEKEMVLLALENALPHQDPGLNLAIRYPDRSAAEKSLEELVAETGLTERKSYLNYELQHLVADHLFDPLGISGDRFRHPWAAILGDYLIFSEHPGNLQQWIDRYIVGDVLALNRAPGMEQPSDIVTWFWDPDRLTTTGKFTKILKQLGPAVLHITARGDNWVWAGEWRPRSAPPAPANLVYQAQIPGEITGPPGFAVDRNGKVRVLVQDTDLKVYGLDENGVTRWVQPQEEPILGRPQAISGLRGKDWWIWTTAHSLYLTDFDGHSAEGWPLALSAQAVAAPLVYYSAALTDYFFFVPAGEGAVYGCRSDGAPLPGWNPKTGLGLLHQPVEHFRFDNNDYFVLVNEQGNLMAFGLNGEERFPFLGLGSGLCRVTGSQDLPGDQRLIFGDSTGQVTVVRPSGEHFTLGIPVNRNQAVRVAFADILGDDRTDYFALEGSELCAYSYSDRGFTRQFRQDFGFRPDTIWTIRSEQLKRSYVGLQDRKREQIWLLDADGKVLPGYPVAGKFALLPIESETMAAPMVVSARGDRVYGYLLRAPD